MRTIAFVLMGLACAKRPTEDPVDALASILLASSPKVFTAPERSITQNVATRNSKIQMADPFNTKIVTPDQLAFDEEVDELILPSSTGAIGILAGHVPLLTVLDAGLFKAKQGGSWKSWFVTEGFAEVQQGGTVEVLVNSIEEGSSIDKAAASKDVSDLEAELAAATEDKDKAVINKKLRTARAKVIAAENS